MENGEWRIALSLREFSIFHVLWCRPAANAIPQGRTVCSHAAPLAYRLIRANTVRPYGFACSNRLITKNPSQREGFQSVKKVRLAYCVSCDSTHKIEFAKQIHKFREHVSRNLYKGRKNVPAGRGFSSVFARKRGFEREAARKTLVFRQPQIPLNERDF